MKHAWIIVNYNLYESKEYFCQGLQDALQRAGIQASILNLQKLSAPEWIKLNKNKPTPDFICSFNYAIREEGKKFYWEEHGIPYLSILVDPAFYAVDLIKSYNPLISCVDKFDCSYLHETLGKESLFWPHAIDHDLVNYPPIKKEYDVVFLGSSYDPEGLRKAWQKKYPTKICNVIEEAAELGLSQVKVPFWKALDITLQSYSISSDEVNYSKLAFFVDSYIRGRDRLQLIRSIKHCRVDVFGGTCWRSEHPIAGWTQSLGDCPNVTVHPAIPFREGIEILKKSKISLNSMPFFKNGSHERILIGLACGNLIITTNNIWVDENFKNGQDLFFYYPNKWQDVNSLIEFYLEHEKEREEIVSHGIEKVVQHHTWDNRVGELLTYLKGNM